MKKVIFLIILLLLPAVIASDFSVSIEPVKNTLFKGENAEFNIEITNNANNADTFLIKTSDLNWIIDDSSVKSLTLSGKKSGIARVIFNPMDDLKYGNYGIILNVKGTTSDLDKVISATIIDPSKIVSFKFLNAEGVDPRRESVIKLQVKNNYDIPLSIKYKADGDVFNADKEISLENMGYEVEEFTANLDPKTKEGEHLINFKVYLNEKLVEETTIPLLIKNYEGLREIITPESSFLLEKIDIKKINDGNAVILDSYVREFSLLERLFTKTSPEASSIIRKDDKYVYKWDINLNPGESSEINIATDYRTPSIFFIALLAVVIFAYSKMKRHIDIQKKVLTIKTEDTFNKIKVVLNIKNKTGKNLKNVKIIETLPGSVRNSGEYGSLSPTKVIREGNVTHLIWIIPQLTSREERVISYKIETKASKIALGRAVVKYNINDKTLMSSSNRISIRT